MFSTLKQGAMLYVFDKSELDLKVARVESVSVPQPRVGSFITNPQDTVIDIKVKIDNETLDFQRVPVGLSTADIGSVTISDNRNDMFSNIEYFMQNSQQVLDSREYHEKVVKACPGMLAKLNENYAKNKERDEVISGVKSEISDLREEVRGTISEIKSLLQVYLKSGK